MEAGKNISEIISVSDVGIVTSGNYRKFFIENGQKYSHTIDPTTGSPVRHNLLSATIIAPNASLADAYATYCMVIGLEESKKFLDSRADLKGYLIYGTEDGGMAVHYTENLKSQLVKQ
jgi:thiamine biosynthesis lipoprotein